MSRPAIFLDRDGTLNVRAPEHEYVSAVEEFVWLPGAVAGAVRLAQAGYLLTVTSNQRGVARGLFDVNVLGAIETLIQRELVGHGCAIEAFRYCIHDEQVKCKCRKPKPGMILELARELDVSLEDSWTIGDSESDVIAGQLAGCRTVLISPARGRRGAEAIASSLDAASRMIVHDDGTQPAEEVAPASNSWTSA